MGTSSGSLARERTPGLLGVEGGLWNGDTTALRPGLLGEAPGSRAAGSKARLACWEETRRFRSGREKVSFCSSPLVT